MYLPYQQDNYNYQINLTGTNMMQIKTDEKRTKIILFLDNDILKNKEMYVKCGDKKPKLTFL